MLRRFAGQEQLDAAALGTVGIDLDAVRDSVEATFGPGALDVPSPDKGREVKGHIPFTRRAKKVLELSLREALALESGSIADGHIALGHPPGRRGRGHEDARRPRGGHRVPPRRDHQHAGVLTALSRPPSGR